ncbi:MAG TPA: hypothetical protein VM638_05440 [Actinomycetota bacterium]|nr:hypothetical protein [Actinomycetota bacterium]
MRGFLGVVLTLALWPAPAGANAASGCDAFPWVQTYQGWGPAANAGRTVTVVYVADCTASDGAIEASGTATVHRGRTTDGSVLAVHPFRHRATWSSGGGRFPWWTCVEEAEYVWELGEWYTFRATAAGGSWSLEVSPGPDGTLTWSHGAC